MAWDSYSDEFIMYELEINELDLTTKEVLNSINPNVFENQHIITGLKPNTLYDLSVRVVTENYGSSLFSDSIEFQTKAPETVMSFNVINRGHSNVDLLVGYDLADQTEEVANSVYILTYNLIDQVCTI